MLHAPLGRRMFSLLPCILELALLLILFLLHLFLFFFVRLGVSHEAVLLLLFSRRRRLGDCLLWLKRLTIIFLELTLAILISLALQGLIDALFQINIGFQLQVPHEVLRHYFRNLLIDVGDLGESRHASSIEPDLSRKHVQ